MLKKYGVAIIGHIINEAIGKCLLKNNNHKVCYRLERNEWAKKGSKEIKGYCISVWNGHSNKISGHE